jgi:hypothetical protein
MGNVLGRPARPGEGVWEDTNLGLRVCKCWVSGMLRLVRRRIERLVIGVWKMCVGTVCRKCMWARVWTSFGMCMYLECGVD